MVLVKEGAEYERLCAVNNESRDWSKWGPYLPERQWGTLREDYSDDGDPWNYFSYEDAISRTYRWGEDGLFGLTDKRCTLCFTIALWNEKDSILKERLFGLTGDEGNHAEDVKEEYFYLDSTPTHSYMKSLYKYPQNAFPYEQLRQENKQRPKEQGEFELVDTKIFDKNEYFDIFVEYAKKDVDDILIRITIENRANHSAKLHILPTLLYRNTWSWKNEFEHIESQAKIEQKNDETFLRLEDEQLGLFAFNINSIDDEENNQIFPQVLFTENETNFEKLYQTKNHSTFVKDAFHQYIIHGNSKAINPSKSGTKAALHYQLNIEGNSSQILYFRLYQIEKETNLPNKLTKNEYEQIFEQRINEANQFYQLVYHQKLNNDEKNIIRQAFAGLLFTKQFYHYIVTDWMKGEGKYFMPADQQKRQSNIKNTEWYHVACRDIISVPDKWEYPWIAAWDLAFHLIPFCQIDPHFAKGQLKLILREWYMHANGQIMAYELDFGDVNPPVIAWSAWRIYKMSSSSREERDQDFLIGIFLKLLLNFTWWVNRKDPSNENLFGGGFMGLDNIGVFDRSQTLPDGILVRQSDGTSWIAFYAVVMLQISLELAGGKDEHPINDAFQDIASKFLEHFTDVVNAINTFGGAKYGLWNTEDGFYYDQIKYSDGEIKYLKVRSFVGLIPLLAVSVIESKRIDCLIGFKKRFEYFLKEKNQTAFRKHILKRETSDGFTYLLTIPNEEQFEKILEYLLDENEFLSDYGIRSLSKHHEKYPFKFDLDGTDKDEIAYAPAESLCGMFGGNSNWRGPIWLPINFLLIEALERYYRFYGPSWKVECPTGSGNLLNLLEISQEITRRLTKLFLKDQHGKRACHGNDIRYEKDPFYRDLLLFYEYFNGDNGKGLGASHQTGWSTLIIQFIEDIAKLRD